MIRALVTLLAVTLLLWASVAAAGQTIKLATLAPPGSPWFETLRDMGEAWREASGGRITLRIYPGGVAGDESDVVRKMRVGQLHAATLSGEGLSYIAPEIRALQMPMMLGSYEELDYVRRRIGLRLEALLEAKGFKVLNWGDAGWIRFFTQRPVVRPDDLKPLRLFTWAGDTAAVEAWKDAGFRPVPLAVTDIHTALQSGLINAFTTTPIAALSFQWFALAKHMTDMKIAPLVGATVMTTRRWRAIPDDVKPRLLEAARDVEARNRRAMRNLGDAAIEAMRKRGLVVHHVPPDVVRQWERSARIGYPRIVGSVVPREIVAEVERIRNEFRARQAGR